MGVSTNDDMHQRWITHLNKNSKNSCGVSFKIWKVGCSGLSVWAWMPLASKWAWTMASGKLAWAMVVWKMVWAMVSGKNGVRN